MGYWELVYRVGLFGQFLQSLWMMPALDLSGLRKSTSRWGGLSRSLDTSALPQFEWTTFKRLNPRQNAKNKTTKRTILDNLGLPEGCSIMQSILFRFLKIRTT